MSLEGIHAVVINDDPVTLATTSGILERAGCRVERFPAGKPALEFLLEEERRWDIVVVDLYMPGIDGWQFCRLLRSAESFRLSSIPILVVSATFRGAEMEAITAATGANSFLSVPFSASDLREHVSELVQGKRPRRTRVSYVFSDDRPWMDAVTTVLRQSGQVISTNSPPTRRELEQADLLVWDDDRPIEDLRSVLTVVRSSHLPVTCLVLSRDLTLARRIELLSAGADLVVPRETHPRLLPDLARSLQRERSLLRVETLLEARTREVSQAGERYRDLFHAVPTALFVLDEDYMVVEANQQAQEEFCDGHAPESESVFPLLVGAEHDLLTLLRDTEWANQGSASSERWRKVEVKGVGYSLTARQLRPGPHTLVALQRAGVEGDSKKNSRPTLGVGDSMLSNARSESPQTILVVDDEPAIRSLVGKIVTRAGYKCLEAEDGEVAVELFKESSEALYAVLMDRSMPGMGGDAALRVMRSIDPNVPLVLSSGDLDQATRERSSADAFIAKPYGPADLVSLLKGLRPTNGSGLNSA